MRIKEHMMAQEIEAGTSSGITATSGSNGLHSSGHELAALHSEACPQRFLLPQVKVRTIVSREETRQHVESVLLIMLTCIPARILLPYLS